MKKWKKLLVTLVAGIMLMSGCAGIGRTPDLMPTTKYTDSNLTCEMIEGEVKDLNKKTKEKIQARKNKGNANTILGVTGALFFWPALFFMDLSKTEMAELQSYESRYDALTYIHTEKKCENELPEFAFDDVFYKKRDQEVTAKPEKQGINQESVSNVENYGKIHTGAKNLR